MTYYRPYARQPRELAGAAPRNGQFSQFAQSREILWPAVDIHETDEQYVFTADLPGISSEQVNITVKDGLLTISGNRERHVSDAQAHRSERVTGYFERSFRLPDSADAEAIDAQLRDGVLRVEIGKAEAARPRRIDITSN